MTRVVTLLTFSRSTKRTHLYKNDAEGAPIAALYINQKAFEGQAPTVITVTIEEG